jgi:hypothetical protein
MNAHAKRIVADLLAKNPRSHAEELGIDLGSGRPRALARWLFACVVSAGGGVRASSAAAAARALNAEGLCDPAKLARAPLPRIGRVLRANGCARFDAQVARSLRGSARMLRDDYGGDLRALREEAGRDAARERDLLVRFPGIGNRGADMFFREVQLAWHEHRPFFDARAIEGARRLGLDARPAALARAVPAAEAHRLAAALVRTASIPPLRVRARARAM